MQNRLLSVLLSLAIAFFALPQRAFAADDICPEGRFSSLCNLRIDNEGGSNIVGNVIILLFVIAIITAIIFIIIGGIKWITSGGDKGKIDQARATLTAAIVGLIIALCSFLIINITTYLLTGQSFLDAPLVIEPLF
ncbi:MAG: hypothetical protein AAB553_07500 [Patescibacteria group bacterium]